MKIAALALAALALSGSAAAEPRPEPILMAYCQDVDNSFEESAFNSLPVLQGIFGHFGYRLHGSATDFDAPEKVKKEIRSSEVVVVTPPRHGTVGRLSPMSDFWQYVPDPGYTGEDSITFLVVSLKQQFSITANILVHPVVDESANPPACEKHFAGGESG